MFANIRKKFCSVQYKKITCLNKVLPQCGAKRKDYENWEGGEWEKVTHYTRFRTKEINSREREIRNGKNI
jgi:hypothetical protein